VVWVASGHLTSPEVYITGHLGEKLQALAAGGFEAGTDNPAAVEAPEAVVIAGRARPTTCWPGSQM
jgi:hypothetical protein